MGLERDPGEWGEGRIRFRYIDDEPSMPASADDRGLRLDVGRNSGRVFCIHFSPNEQRLDRLYPDALSVLTKDRKQQRPDRARNFWHGLISRPAENRLDPEQSLNVVKSYHKHLQDAFGGASATDYSPKT